MRKEEMEELFITGKNKRNGGQRKTTVNICVQNGELDITVTIRCDQKCERQEAVVLWKSVNAKVCRRQVT